MPSLTGLPATPLDEHRQGEGPVPWTAIPVKTHNGYIVYEGTEDELILKYEDCLAEPMKWELRLWTIDLIAEELEGKQDPKVLAKNIWSPHWDMLPCLPSCGSPNRWDYRGRPWVYMDAPHEHEAIPVKSSFMPPAAHVNLAVLVDCECKPQYFPNLDVAKSAVSASTWQSHQVKVVDRDGVYNPSVTPERAARVIAPAFYDGPSCVVEAIF